ncbi:MAG: hypothetical protein PHQ22_09610 [Sulfuricurvum sp.]|nr:hypothetical protein [Sulfuricurvum sp.]MDD5387435.1 hypothetical protein [Sulfuricurvum sp.]
MADPLFQKLRESNRKKVGLTSTISMSLTEDEMDIFTKKADELEMEAGALLREYVLGTSAFENVFIEKKARPKSAPKTVESSGGFGEENMGGNE